MKILISAALLLTSVVSVAVAAASQKESIKLQQGNFVSLVGPVDSGSITATILGLEAAPTDKPILFINSGGGEVQAGLELVQYLKTTNKTVTCVANIAISMAQQILQHCHNRVGTEYNVMMQHRVALGAQGSPDQIIGLVEAIKQIETQMNKESARRIGISLGEFQRKVSGEWWTAGEESLKQNIVDKLALVSCASELYKIKTKKVLSLGIFSLPVIENGCPLIPLQVDNEVERNYTAEELKQIQYILNPASRKEK